MNRLPKLQHEGGILVRYGLAVAAIVVAVIVDQLLQPLVYPIVVPPLPRGGQIRLCAEPDPGGVCFAVEDTGIGIAAEDLPYVFERFWQKHRNGGQRGTGLGLAIVRGIVDAQRRTNQG